MIEIGIVVGGLVLLALIGRDTWLRTLAARRVTLTDEAENRVRAVEGAIEKVRADVAEHHERLVRQERQIPAPRRA